jgi:hypothetical protein
MQVLDTSFHAQTLQGLLFLPLGGSVQKKKKNLEYVKGDEPYSPSRV